MAYIVYMGKVLLPVTPGKITMKCKGQNKTVPLIDGSQINILKPAGLTEISFEAFIPQQAYHFALYDNGKAARENYSTVIKNRKRKNIYEGNGFMRAKYFLDQFEKMKTSRKPFQFTIYREHPGQSVKASATSLFHTNLTVSLEDYTVKEDAGEGSDLVVSINLKAYRKYGTKKAVWKKSQIRVIDRSRDLQHRLRAPIREFTVAKGDTLNNIVRKYCGKNYTAEELYQHNKKAIEEAAKKHGRKSSSKGMYLYPGTKLILL